MEKDDASYQVESRVAIHACSASRSRKQLIIFNVPPAALIPWIVILAFGVILIRPPVLVLAAAYTISYGLMKRHGVSVYGLVFRYLLKRNNGRLYIKPK